MSSAQESKTRVQLIEELTALKRELADMKSRLEEDTPAAENGARQAPRQNLVTDIEFIGDFDLVQAQGVDISKTGISFYLDEALPFEMRFTIQGVDHQYRARLVWVKRQPDGGFRCGLQFVPPEEHPHI